MYVGIGKAARTMGVSRSTLRGWDKKKLFKADFLPSNVFRTIFGRIIVYVE